MELVSTTRDKLLKPLQLVSGIVERRHTLPILANLLFKKNDKIVINKLAKKVDKNYKELSKPIEVGATVKMKNNYQVGEVLDIKGKRAIVKIGQLPMNIDLVDLVVVEKIITNP